MIRGIKVHTHAPSPYSSGHCVSRVAVADGPAGTKVTPHSQLTGSGSMCPEVYVVVSTVSAESKAAVADGPAGTKVTPHFKSLPSYALQVSCGRPSSPRLLKPTAQYPVLETRLTVLSLTSQSSLDSVSGPSIDTLFLAREMNP